MCFRLEKHFPRNLWSIQIPRPTHIQRIGRNLAAHVVKEPWELRVGWTVPYVQLRRMIGFIWISLLELYRSFETQTSRSYRLPFLPEIHASVGKNTNERTNKQGYLRDTTPFFTRFFTTIVAEKNRLCNMKLYSCPPFHP